MINKLKKINILRALYKLPLAAKTYHFLLAFLANLVYGFPSKKIKVIGVTGTKGKTTTCSLISQILELSGRKTGFITTVSIKIGDNEETNRLKQTMPGRFTLQKIIKQMVNEKCEYAIIETSSEGIEQYRHRFIDYNTVVFTNLSPEHIERHKGFDNYRKAKLKLFKKAAKKKGSVGIYNLDDKNAAFFLGPGIKHKYGYCIDADENTFINSVGKIIKAKNVLLEKDKTKFSILNNSFETNLIGKFNLYNTLAAVSTALSEGIPIEKIKKAAKEIKPPAGRFEVIDKGQKFEVIIDYAHEPASLEAAYKAVLLLEPHKIIGVLGAQGGGRDRWKRVEMGKIAAKYCDYIILTNEDPYDENPENIVRDIEEGIKLYQNKANSVYKIIDRGGAIRKAISLANSGDTVILTGKGGEVWMCVANNKKIPWNEKKIVEEILEKELEKEKAPITISEQKTKR